MGVYGHRSGSKMSQYVTLVCLFVVCFNPKVEVGFFSTVFKGFTPFTVCTKYWLHSPCCRIYP